MAVTPEAEPPMDARSRRVLVVDDNVDAAEALAAVLDLLGIGVEVAHDGPAALVVGARHPPDLAFLDIGLPGMDGYELARRFRSDPALEKTRLVALTGYGQPSDVQRSLDAGFDEHLVKPVSIEDIEAAIGRLAPS